jgi:hypothetical protein
MLQLQWRAGRYDNTILTRFLAHTDCFIIPAQARGGIFKLLRSLGIYSKELVPPAYVAWRVGTTILFLLGS